MKYALATALLALATAAGVPAFAQEAPTEIRLTNAASPAAVLAEMALKTNIEKATELVRAKCPDKKCKNTSEQVTFVVGPGAGFQEWVAAGTPPLTKEQNFGAYLVKVYGWREVPGEKNYMVFVMGWNTEKGSFTLAQNEMQLATSKNALVLFRPPQG